MKTFFGSIPAEVRLPIIVVVFALIVIVTVRQRQRLLAQEDEEGHGGDATKALTKQKWAAPLLLVMFVLLVANNVSELV